MGGVWIQIAIAVTGVVAILLTQQGNERWKKYACMFGLAGQPFWFISTYLAEQWGIFLLCCFYTYAWCLGIYNHWVKPKLVIRRQHAALRKIISLSEEDNDGWFTKP